MRHILELKLINGTVEKPLTDICLPSESGSVLYLLFCFIISEG